jgi:hypothetical protein
MHAEQMDKKEEEKTLIAKDNEALRKRIDELETQLKTLKTKDAPKDVSIEMS